MLGLWITLGVVGFLLIVLVVYIIHTYNSLIRLRNNAEEGFSSMDVYLKKRYDLIPNLVETVKGYAKHEKETLQAVISARNMAVEAKTADDRAAADNQLSSTLKTLFALTENYPDLKANTNFMDLQQQLKNLELEISNSRRYYNATVKRFNDKILMFPSNIIARWFKFEKKEMFAVDSPEERKNVKVEF